MSDRLDYNFSWAWRMTINRFTEGKIGGKDWPDFMYDAISVADEAPRLKLLFAMEREGKLPDIHQHCSHSPVEPVEDNHLTCCMGTECRKCPYLLALEQKEMTPEQQDMAKAWTCITHILKEQEHKSFDTSEGFILTTEDRMYWQRVYQSLSSSEEGR